MLDSVFARWARKPAERDVAFTVLNGPENEQIVAARGSPVGMFRAQTTRVSAKAGVASRSKLISVFIEKLLAERLAPAAGAAQPQPPRTAS